MEVSWKRYGLGAAHGPMDGGAFPTGGLRTAVQEGIRVQFYVHAWRGQREYRAQGTEYGRTKRADEQVSRAEVKNRTAGRRRRL